MKKQENETTKKYKCYTNETNQLNKKLNLKYNHNTCGIIIIYFIVDFIIIVQYIYNHLYVIRKNCELKQISDNFFIQKILEKNSLKLGKFHSIKYLNEKETTIDSIQIFILSFLLTYFDMIN